jgi:hypothetical protein
MNRTTSLDRRYRRILVGGVAASILVHAALFASLRFEIPGLQRNSVITMAAPDDPVRELLPMEVLQFTAAPASTTDAGAASLAPSSKATAPAPRIAAATSPDAAVVEAAAEPAYETLNVVDPLTNAAVRPIAFDALPAVASAAPAAEADDGVEVYVPGSVGKAKRDWARGIGEAESGPGGGRIGIVAIGGGHCPMPGRVPVSWGRSF